MRLAVAAVAFCLICVAPGAQAAGLFRTTTNWAGYVVHSHPRLTNAGANLTVPTLDCARTPNAGESTWVGLGGATPGAGFLLQAGVQSVCVNGVQTDSSAWWELFPPYGQVFFHAMTISPGDRVRATVQRTAGGVWEARLDDLNTGISSVMRTGEGWGTVSDSSPNTWLARAGTTPGLRYTGGHTAEWIEEAYGDALSSSLTPLADFKAVHFTKLTASLRRWSLTPKERIGIVQNGVTPAVPSKPDASRRGFRGTYVGKG